MSLPIAVKIVEIHVPIEGQRIDTPRLNNQSLNRHDNVFPICCCMCCVVIILFIILSILKFIK